MIPRFSQLGLSSSACDRIDGASAIMPALRRGLVGFRATTVSRSASHDDVEPRGGVL